MLKRLTVLIASLLCLCSSAHATIYYLSPTAPNNNGAGTSAGTAWLTFAFALPRLFPGDTLTLVDGTYTTGNSGLPSLWCAGGGHRNGTAALPITIRALSERKAHLSNDGTAFSLLVRNCSYWVFEGLYASGANVAGGNPGSPDGIFEAWDNSHHLTFRRNLLYRNNHYKNQHGLVFIDVHSSLVEENELYFFHRHGIAISGYTQADVSSFNVFRRNYGWGGDRPDVGGGFASNPTTGSDVGITCYPCNNTIFENNIMENWGQGYDIMALMNTKDNRYLGNISLGNGYGATFNARSDFQNTLDSMPQNTQVTNMLFMNNGPGLGLYLRSTKNTHCDNCTFIGGTGASATAIAADFNGATTGDGLPTVFGTNILIANNAQGPFTITNQSEALFNEILVFGNGAAASPAIPNAYYTNVITSNPAMGTCKVFIPAGSPAKGTGVGGADIGANILYRYQDGVLTTSPLWNPTTGAFPCGATVAGVNDIAGSSCFDVHQRLNVNSGGCTLPGAVVDTAETFYGTCPGTGGNCLFAGTACAPQTAFGLMGADDILTLGNGIYTGDACMINPPPNLHGRAGARITVKATNAGQVIIDGQNARIPVMIDQNNYWTVEGLNVRNSSFSDVIIQNSTNAIVRTSIAWDANSLADANLFVVRTSTDTLLEDVAAWGGGRRCLHLDGSTNTTVLRAFFMKNATNQAGPCVTTTGTSTGTTLANIIATVDLSASSSTAVGNIIGPESYVGLAGFTTTTTKLLGSIAYSVAAQNPGVQTALIDAGVPFTSVDSGDVVTVVSDNNLTLRRGSPVTAGLEFSGSAPRTIIDADHWTDSPVLLPDGQITEGTAGGGEGFESTFNDDLLNSAASSQPANGAWLRYCYTAAGTIDTGCNLWPWAMNARIQDALITSGRAAQGGLNGTSGTDLTAFIFNQTGSVLTLPLVLAFDIQPISYVEDAIRPATKVCVYDSSTPALLQTNYATAIVLPIEDNPADGTLTGACSVIPTNGCAIYADRSIDNAGVGYSFKAASGALTPVESAAFDVIATGVTAPPTVRMLQLK